jgi:hypothetical protein
VKIVKNILIVDSRFVEKHSNHYYVAFRGFNGKDIEEVSFDHPIYNEHSKLCFIGSSRGVVALIDPFTSSAIIWNPFH